MTDVPVWIEQVLIVPGYVGMFASVVTLVDLIRGRDQDTWGWRLLYFLMLPCVVGASLRAGLYFAYGDYEDGAFMCCVAAMILWQWHSRDDDFWKRKGRKLKGKAKVAFRKFAQTLKPVALAPARR